MARLNSLSFNDDGVSGTFRFFSYSQFGEFGRLVTASFLSEKFETDFLNLSDLNVCQVCVLSPGVISGSEKAWPPGRGLSQLSLLSRLFFYYAPTFTKDYVSASVRALTAPPVCPHSFFILFC